MTSSEIPTPNNPRIYIRKLLRPSEKTWSLIIPIDWKRRNEERLKGDITAVEVKDCGNFLVVIPKLPERRKLLHP